MTSTSWLNSILSKISPAALFAITVSSLGCGDYGLDRYHPLPASTYSMPVSSLLVETASTAEVADSVFKLKASGSAEYGCINTGAAGATTGSASGLQDTLTDQTHRQAMPLTTPSAITVTGYKVRVRRSGGPAGNMYVDLKNAASEIPGSTVLGTSDQVNITTATTGPTGTLITFPMTTPVDVAAATEIAVVLTPDSAASLNGTNKFGVTTTNDGTGTACSSFPVYQVSLDSGSNWIDSNNNSTHRGYFSLTVNTYNSSGTGYWVVQADKSVTWNMSSFTVSEKPNNAGGTITYDIGSAEDSTPVYSQTGLTITQVQALTGVSGAYLFVRVNLASGSPFYERAEVGNASIANY